MGNTERFSNRVQNYVLYRPHYPKKVITYLQDQIGFDQRWVVADIGSGTGISSALFLENGNMVYCVEPNLKMRQAAEQIFKNQKTFKSVEGTAEATSLEDKSVDLIVAAQAFHWFDAAAAKREFHRIAKKNAYLLLMWNVRSLASDFEKGYEQMLFDYSLDYEAAKHRNIDENKVKELFSPNSYSFKSLPNFQTFDLEGIKGRLLSSSYAPLENHANYKPMMDRLEQLFYQYAVDAKIRFDYTCELYYGKIE